MSSPLAQTDPAVFAAIRARDRAAGVQPRADRLRELRQRGGARGAGLGPHEQVRRGLSRQALLRRLRVRRRGRAARDRPRASELFGAEDANVQPHSGSQANMAVYFSQLKPGDTILAMNLSHGGHLTHGSPVNFSGKFFKRRALRRARERRPDRLRSGRATSRAQRAPEDDRRRATRPIRARSTSRRSAPIADEVGALLMADMAHFAGLVAAGIHPSPVPHCDVRHDDDAQDAARSARRADPVPRDVREGAQLVGLPRQPGRSADARHRRQGRGVRARRCSPSSSAYQRQIVANAKALADGLMRARASGSCSGGTDNHLMLVDLRGTELTGKVAEETLDRGRASPSTRTPSRSIRARRSSRAASGSARRPSPRAACARPRWTQIARPDRARARRPSATSADARGDRRRRARRSARASRSTASARRSAEPADAVPVLPRPRQPGHRLAARQGRRRHPAPAGVRALRAPLHHLRARRRRRCPLVVKKDGRREPFDRTKIVAGLTRACEKRPVSAETIEAVADRIERQVQERGEQRDRRAAAIGEAVMRELHDARRGRLRALRVGVPLLRRRRTSSCASWRS